MNHVMKALNIILNHNEKKLVAEISENQSGFRPRKGTREGILNLRIIIQRYLEVQKPEFMCFIDYEKAFDHVYLDRIMQCLDHVDMDCNDQWMIEKLNWQQTATARFVEVYSEFFPIKRACTKAAFYHQNFSTCIQKRSSKEVMNYFIVLLVERILTT